LNFYYIYFFITNVLTLCCCYQWCQIVICFTFAKINLNSKLRIEDDTAAMEIFSSVLLCKSYLKWFKISKSLKKLCYLRRQKQNFFSKAIFTHYFIVFFFRKSNYCCLNYEKFLSRKIKITSLLSSIKH